jgi:excisionase family DNA binding protein
MPPTTTGIYLDPAEVAELYGISERTVRRRIAEGELPAYRLGPRHIRIRREDVEALLVRIPTAGIA